MRILYVEDEPSLLRMTTDALLSDGHDVQQASDCLTGLQMIRAARRPFDLLITDVETPGGIDGWELAQLARFLSPEISVIYATGARLDMARPVADAVIIPKPFTLMTLRRHIPRKVAAAIGHFHPASNDGWFIPSAAGQDDIPAMH